MLKTLFVSTVIGVMTASYASAHIEGEASTPTGSPYIAIGESNVPFGPHTIGKAGVGVSSFPLFGTWARVDFQGLSAKLTPVSVDGIQVYTYDKDTSHRGRNLGTFDFVKVSSGDVWYGIWSADNNAHKTHDWSNSQVYYAGDDTGTTIPASGTATYSVHGLNHFNGSNVLHGEFTAKFGTKSLTGSIKNDNLKVALSAASFDRDGVITGGAQAYGEKGQASGVLHGHFFGANAASLAGFAQFDSNRDYDTAFGGTKK